MNYLKAANTVLGVSTRREIETNKYQGITIVSGTTRSGKSSMMAAINKEYYGRFFDTEVLLILTEELWCYSPLRGDNVINGTGWWYDQFMDLFSGDEIRNFTHVVIDTLPPHLSMEESSEILLAMKKLHKELGINFLVSCHKRSENK